MNKRSITMGLIGGTAIITGLGMALPELYIAMASMVMGGASLCMALQVYRDTAKRKINKVILEELR